MGSSSAAVEDAAAAFGRKQRWITLGVFGVLCGAIVISYWYRGLATSAGVALLATTAVLPLFQYRGRGTVTTGDPPEAVLSEFETPENPLTAAWFARGDRIEGETNCSDARLELPSTIVGARTFRIGVRTVDESTRRLQIFRGEEVLAETTLHVEERDDGSTVEFRTTRSPIQLIQIAHFLLLPAVAEGLLAAKGYRIVEHSWKVRPRNPFG